MADIEVRRSALKNISGKRCTVRLGPTDFDFGMKIQGSWNGGGGGVRLPRRVSSRNATGRTKRH